MTKKLFILLFYFRLGVIYFEILAWDCKKTEFGKGRDFVMQKTTAVIRPDGRLGTVRENIPDLKEHEALIKVYASLISPGTEMNLAKTRRQNPDKDGKDVKFGYSNAGVIVKTKGEVKGLAAGMRAAAMGAGAAEHTDYAVVPVNLIVPIPDEVSYEQASYLSLAATALQAVRRTAPHLGEYGVALGQGIVGNLAAQLYRLAGARVQVWDGFESRLKIARKCGLTETVNFLKADGVAAARKFAAPWGLDFALFAFGGNAEKTFGDIKKCMKVSADGHAMGRIVLVGGCRVPVDGGAASGNLDILVSSRTGAGYHDRDWEYGKDYPAAFVQFTTQRNAQELIRLIAEKRLQVDPLTTHRFKLEDAAAAGDLLCEHPDRALGVIFEMNRDK